jgi:hypothetical protein
VPDEAAGKRAKCPRCGKVQTVPADPDVVVAEITEPQPSAVHAAPANNGEDVVPVETPEAYSAEPRRSRPSDGAKRRPPERARRPRDEELVCPRCEELIQLTDEECPGCGFNLAPRALLSEWSWLKGTRSLFQGLMLMFILPAFTLMGVGGLLWITNVPAFPIPIFIGSGLLALGALFFGPTKRFNLAWMLLGLLGVIGLIVVACLPDQKGKRMKLIRQFLRADWETSGEQGSPPVAPAGFPFAMIFGLLGILASGAIIGSVYLFTMWAERRLG